MYRTILLNKGKYTLVDNENFEWLNKWHWWISNGYVIRKEYLGKINLKKKYKTIFMHRVINKTLLNFDTDHINRNKLDNRRCNLRTVTKSQNQFNTGLWKSNTSGVKGVYWRKDRNKWQAQIQLNKKLIKLGCYISFKNACLVRKQSEIIYHAI